MAKAKHMATIGHVYRDMDSMERGVVSDALKRHPCWKGSTLNVRQWKSALGQYRPCARLVEGMNKKSSSIVDRFLVQ